MKLILFCFTIFIISLITASAGDDLQLIGANGFAFHLENYQLAGLCGLLFHEPWWLSAATGGRYEEVSVKNGNQVIGRLPFVATRQTGFCQLRMPALTHVLGPVVDAGEGKIQTQMRRRQSIIHELIDQLPPFDFFKQACDSSNLDGLAFQDRGFYVSAQYSFQIDCQRNIDELWNDMHQKTRNSIRAAKHNYLIATLDNPETFIHFYFGNMKKVGRQDRIEFDNFPRLFSECRSRDSGEILVAHQFDGTPAAMVFLVWGHGVMYYLISTRDPHIERNGAVGLLLWSAMERAHQRGLTFDFDGVIDEGTARFYMGFGGRINTRLILTRSRPLYGALRYVRQKLTINKVRNISYHT